LATGGATVVAVTDDWMSARDFAPALAGTAAEGLGLIGLAVASFILPLRVMHGGLVQSKLQLLDEMQDRLKQTLARIHATVVADDLSRADELNKTLTSLLAERDVLLHLPTWPWSTGTFRGFASAVLLPIVIWLVIRVLERVV
jgi:hypothetical protein